MSKSGPDHDNRRYSRTYRGAAPVCVLLLQLAMASCATLRVPERTPSFKAEDFVRGAKSGFVLEARAVADRESYWDLFEDNLPEAGIAAIWVNLRNERAEPVDPGLRTWRLRSHGRDSRVLSTDELFERYYKARKIRAFSIHSDRQARDKLQALRLDGTTPLGPAENRSGFVFFRVRPSGTTEWLRDARLVLRSVRLADGHNISLELPLTHASP